MKRRLSLLVALAAISWCITDTAQAQYGGLQVQVGGYGPGIQLGGFGYGNAPYNGYRNGYSYGNGYQRGYGNYRQPGAVYLNSGNYGGYRYNSYPSMSFGIGSPRSYAAPGPRYGWRRFR